MLKRSSIPSLGRGVMAVGVAGRGFYFCYKPIEATPPYTLPGEGIAQGPNLALEFLIKNGREE